MILYIQQDGRIITLYDEAINLYELGSLQIERASYVEPDYNGLWWADLGPVSGPKLGPFALRSQALMAEQDWLNAKLANTYCNKCDGTGIITLRCTHCYGRSAAYNCPCCSEGLIDKMCEECDGTGRVD